MANNIEEEHLEHSKPTVTETASDELVQPDGKQIINPNSAKENMEVHQHAHHAGKKNWKSYIWEFLMLFFAVFCGFLAEWRLEQVIEHHREEVFIHSIVEDIGADVQQTEKLTVEIQGRIERTDSLLMALSSSEVMTNSNKAYELWLSTLGFPDFVQNDRTIQQLKSSGALRLIRNNAVSDAIMEYDQVIRLLDITQNNMNALASNNPIFYQTFDFIELNKQHSLSVPLTDKGKTFINEAYANRFFWRKNLVGLRNRIASLNKKGAQIAKFIKEEYDIK